MDRGEIEAELSANGAQELLVSASAAYMSYIGTDATPRTEPILKLVTAEQGSSAAPDR